MRALVWQHHAVFIWLQAQGRDQVAAAPAVEGDLMDVHRRLVGLEDAIALPLFERRGGAPVIGAGPRDMNDVEG